MKFVKIKMYISKHKTKKQTLKLLKMDSAFEQRNYCQIIMLNWQPPTTAYPLFIRINGGRLAPTKGSRNISYVSEHILAIICWKYVIEVCTHDTALPSLTWEIHPYPSFYNYYCGFHLTTSRGHNAIFKVVTYLISFFWLLTYIFLRLRRIVRLWRK
jgi:hypothetical protein